MNNYEYHLNIFMPDSYFEQDEQWIRDMLLRLKPSVRARVAIRYSAVYQQYFEQETATYRKENSARKAANTRLRIFVKNHASYLDGYVSEPEQLKRG